jgi:hypothetical protein
VPSPPARITAFTVTSTFGTLYTKHYAQYDLPFLTISPKAGPSTSTARDDGHLASCAIGGVRVRDSAVRNRNPEIKASHMKMASLGFFYLPMSSGIQLFFDSTSTHRKT